MIRILSDMFRNIMKKDVAVSNRRKSIMSVPILSFTSSGTEAG